ncbi:MAG: hypothetical protein WKF50_12540 [Nocardioides sp.]
MAIRRGPVTATEVIAERERRLREDPDYRAQVEEAEAARAARAEAARRATTPVLEDLRAVGVEVYSLWHLYEQPEAYDSAIPVLLDHMRRDYPESVMSDIGHALPFKPAAKWWHELRAMYLSTGSSALRDRLAAALAQAAVKKHYEDLLGFLGDEALGESRIYFLRPANRIGNRMEQGKGRAVVEQFVGNETLGREAAAILAGRSRSQ